MSSPTPESLLTRRSVEFQAVREFLGSETLSHFVDVHHHQLAVLSKKATVADALAALKDKKVLSCPVVDEDGEYAGAVSVGDILRGLIINLEVNLGEHFHEEIANIGATELDNVGKFFASKPVSSLMHEADLWMKGDSSTNLLTLLTEGFRIQDRRVHHRVYICDPAKPAHHVIQQGQTTVVNIAKGTEKEGASSWHPTDVVSQLDLVAFLWEKRDKLQMQYNKTLEELELTPTVVYTVPTSTPALVAFRHMAKDHKNCVGVVDEAGKLVGQLVVTDLRNLPVEHFAVLLLPVAEFLNVVHGKGPSAEEVLAGKRPQGTPAQLLAELSPVQLTAASTFSQALEQLVAKREHRVWVVDAAGKPTSIVTLTDVLRTISETKVAAPMETEETAEASGEEGDAMV